MRCHLSSYLCGHLSSKQFQAPVPSFHITTGIPSRLAAVGRAASKSLTIARGYLCAHRVHNECMGQKRGQGGWVWGCGGAMQVAPRADHSECVWCAASAAGTMREENGTHSCTAVYSATTVPACQAAFSCMSHHVHMRADVSPTTCSQRPTIHPMRKHGCMRRNICLATRSTLLAECCHLVLQ